LSAVAGDLHLPTGDWMELEVGARGIGKVRVEIITPGLR
jgi:hypothetical protein